VSVHAGEVQQHHVAGAALDQRPDGGALESEDQVAFPVAGHSAIRGLGRPLANHDLGPHEGLAASARAGSRYPQRPARAQAGGQLTAQRAAALHVEGLVDRLVRDPHPRIIGEIEHKPVSDLLRAPRPGPAPIHSTTVAAADPAHLRPRNRAAVGPGDRAGETVLHVCPQRVVGGELRDLRATGASLGMPLRCRRAVHDRVATRRCVTAQLPRNRRRRPTQTASDSTHPHLLGVKNRDLFPLSERQIAPRHRDQRDWRHTASVAEPPAANRLRHARRHGRVLA
jgi:hypothetical protein